MWEFIAWAWAWAFVNKTLNKQAEEREETPNTSGLTNQQEQMYATEW